MLCAVLCIGDKDSKGTKTRPVTLEGCIVDKNNSCMLDPYFVPAKILNVLSVLNP